MKHHLDWSGYENAGQGDAYAGIPASGGDFAKAVAVCIGDKLCQSVTKGVMCPSFRVTGDAFHSPGGRVKVLKDALNGLCGAAPFGHERLAAAMDLCVACKGCKRECANQVDMAALKIECLAQRNALFGVPWRDRLFASLPLLLRWPRLLRLLVSLRNRHGWLARLTERWLGITASLPLPLPVARPFREPEDLSGPGGDGREVLLFVDTYARHFEPELAQAAAEVLSACGYRVRYPQPVGGGRPLCCGRTWLSLGQVERARAEARRLLEALRPALQSGIPIVGLEPSCILSLRDEHLKLGLGAEAQALARQVWLFEEFIAREAERGGLSSLLGSLPRKALVHGHCHQKAVGAMKSMRRALRLVPDLSFEFLDTSCCGMAGHFGLEAEHSEVSLRMAKMDLLPALEQADACVEVIANGFSCRHRIGASAGRQAKHLALVLREALSS